MKAAYSYKDWQFALIWQQPFQHKYKMFESGSPEPGTSRKPLPSTVATPVTSST